MAIVLKNLVTKGLSGKLGDTLVFRQVGNKTVVSSTPTVKAEPTDAQKAQRERFQVAVLYGKGQLADTQTKKEYEAASDKKKGQSAYNIAVADFFNAPSIDGVSLENYFGMVGDTIRVRVVDDFKVERVAVEIYNDDGSLLEKGDAVIQGNGLDWVYTTTMRNFDLPNDRIVIKAFDKPGNVTKREETL